MAAATHPMPFDMLGMRYHLERRTRMPRLSTALLAALVPQAFGFLFQPIVRGWLPAVAAILGQLILQRLYPFAQRLYDPDQTAHQYHHRIFPLPVDGADFFFIGQL